MLAGQVSYIRQSERIGERRSAVSRHQERRQERRHGQKSSSRSYRLGDDIASIGDFPRAHLSSSEPVRAAPPSLTSSSGESSEPSSKPSGEGVFDFEWPQSNELENRRQPDSAPIPSDFNVQGYRYHDPRASLPTEEFTPTASSARQNDRPGAQLVRTRAPTPGNVASQHSSSRGSAGPSSLSRGHEAPVALTRSSTAPSAGQTRD